MDIKEQALVNYYYGKLIENTFDEKDVYAFLLLLKNQCNESASIKELVDLMLHRNQHKGYVKDYLFDTKKKFESLGKSKAAFRIEEVYSFKKIKSGINKVLAACQLEALANDKINDLVTCLISILQQIMITDENDSEIGKLFFALSSKQIILMAEIEVAQNFIKKTNAVFPVLTTNNHYIDIKKQDQYDTPYLFDKQVIEVINQQGRLEITIPK